MAVGTKAGLLDGQEPLQSFLKHRLLGHYAPVYAAALGQGTSQPVVLVDGYAGAGRYPDGTPQGAELLLIAAQPQLGARVVLLERDAKYFDSLAALVDLYQGKRSREWVRFIPGDNRKSLPSVIDDARGSHLFLYLDPCGAGLDFHHIAQIFARRGSYPRTEMMLNFSGALVRRTGARVVKDGLDAPSLDAACGDTWWRPIAQRAHDVHGDWELALLEVVRQYSKRLADETGQLVIPVPVKRKVTHDTTMFYMVCTTGHPYGLFSLSDAIAVAISEWMEEPERRDDPVQGALFGESVARRPVEKSKQTLRANVLNGLEAIGAFKLTDQSEMVLEGIVGELKTTEVGEELRDMARAGLIALDRGQGTRYYVVRPPGR